MNVNLTFSEFDCPSKSGLFYLDDLRTCFGYADPESLLPETLSAVSINPMNSSSRLALMLPSGSLTLWSPSSCHELRPDISRSRSMRFWNASSLRTVMLLECHLAPRSSACSTYLPSSSNLSLLHPQQPEAFPRHTGCCGGATFHWFAPDSFTGPFSRSTL